MDIQKSLSLSGKWLLRPDPDDRGRKSDWQRVPAETLVEASVPGTFAEYLPDHTGGPVWYYRSFAPSLTVGVSGRVLLRFDSVEYLCDVWLNGEYLGRHLRGEEEFYFDVTGALSCGENLLAVRVFCPCYGERETDGIRLDCIPNAGRANGTYFDVNPGGITGEVTLCAVPQVRVEDVWLRPDCDSGALTAVVTLFNCADDAETALTLSVGSAAETTLVYTAPGGISEVSLTVCVPEHRLWSPDRANLYTAALSVSGTGGTDRREVRFGFRDLRVVDGYFRLNGKRIFFRSAHTEPGIADVYRARAMDFNMLRYLTKLPPKPVLDLCDELGMMVYDECVVSWAMWDYPGMPGDFRACCDNMIKRDRNHPSVVIWGLFNEQLGPNAAIYNPEKPAAAVFGEAVAYIERLRELDPTRLALLSSGRWDGRPAIGSLSNPGSTLWEHQWGAESPDNSAEYTDKYWYHMDGYFKDTGDIHLYPTVPVSNEGRHMLRTIGCDSKPVFVSEYGLGYQPNLYKMYYEAVCAGTDPAHPLMKHHKLYIDMFEEFLREHGLDGVYPFPEDFIYASLRAGLDQRRLSFDLLRSNPAVAGYSLTSFSSAQEGLKMGVNEDIPGMPSTIRECWQPLRWALFCEDYTVYADRPFEIEAVLCNEDVLAPGEYNAAFRVSGPEGTVWKKDCKITYPAKGYGGLPPLAATVMREHIALPEGEYTFGAALNDSASPSGGRLALRVMEAPQPFAVRTRVALLGVRKSTCDFLRGLGCETVSFADGSAEPLVLVGALDEEMKTPAVFDALYKAASAGSYVVFLSPCAFGEKQTEFPYFMEWKDNLYLPFSRQGRRRYVRNWLYHVDNLHIRHQLFDGINDRGLITPEQLGEVYPEYFLTDMETPSLTVCACAALGMSYRNDAPELGVTFAEYNVGEGRVVINAFRIEENIGKTPVADRLLRNIIRCYGMPDEPTR